MTMRGQRLRGLRSLTNLAFERRLESSVSTTGSADVIGCGASAGSGSTAGGALLEAGCSLGIALAVDDAIGGASSPLGV
jgi:hypothetical protein